MLAYCFICLHWLASMQATQLADLAFGHAQLEQFMRDRPEVRLVLIKEAALRNQLERGFGGLETGLRVHWEDREVQCGRASEYWPRHNESSGRVRVTKASTVSGQDKCVMLVLELENAKSDGRYNAMLKMAWEGRMSRGDYARSNAHLEFQSIQRTREFFQHHPLPPTATSSHYNELLRFPTEFSVYLESLSDSRNVNPNLVEYWGQGYDKLISQRKDELLEMVPTR
jgi:hypothetical protein